MNPHKAGINLRVQFLANQKQQNQMNPSIDAASAAERAYVAALRSNPLQRLQEQHDKWERALCGLRALVATLSFDGDEERAQNWAEHKAHFDEHFHTETLVK